MDNDTPRSQTSHTSPFFQALIAGAVAGTTVDLSLFPLDTLKTRLQSSQGFLRSGGFQGVYAGVGSAVIGSAPGAALFFVSYESVKNACQNWRQARSSSKNATHGESQWMESLDHMLAASIGEVAACAVRVPTEVVKQRAQAHQGHGSLAVLKSILNLRRDIGLAGVGKELYRGWSITILREVPFTLIQFPIWEALKRTRQRSTGKRTVSAVESGLFGSFAGAVAAGLTTPLDVLKTRMMLAAEKESARQIARQIMLETGMRGFFSGIGPRIAWISLGGAVFLGSYQWAYNKLGE